MSAHTATKTQSLDNTHTIETIELGRVSYQAWRKNQRKHLHFVSPSYRAKAFWGLSGLGCIVFLWSVLQAFLAADLAALDSVQKLSFNYSMVFTIVIGLLLAGLCLVICFQGLSLRIVDGEDGIEGNEGWLELRQSFKKPRIFPLANYRYSRIYTNESKQAGQTNLHRNSYPHALKNNSHTLNIRFANTSITLESQDLKGIEKLKNYLDTRA